MPQIDANRSASRKAVVRVKRKKKATVYKVKAPARQPGPISDAEQKKVDRVNRKETRERISRNTEKSYGSQSKQIQTEAKRQKKAGRIKELRKNRKTGLKLVASELDKAGKFVSRHAIVPNTGAGPSVAVRPLGHKSSGRVATALSPKPVKLSASKPGRLVGRAVEDAFNFPAQAISSTYDVGAGVVEAAKGHPQRLKSIAKAVDKTDPVYNLGAAGVAELRGNSKEAKRRLKQAGRAASEHPGFTAAELYGLKGTAGRVAGRTARTGVVGKTAKRAASTEREARTVPNTHIRQHREYSKDVITKGAQVAVEKAKRRRAVRLERKAGRETGERAEVLREKAATAHPARLHEREIQRQVDEHIAAQEDVRRIHRAKITTKTRKALKGADSATVARTQGIIRAYPADVRAYIKDLETEYPKLTGAKARANRDLRQNLSKALESGDLDRVEAQAREYQQITAPLQKQLVKRKLLDEGQEERARLTPYAVRRMGATQENGRMVRPVKVVRVKGGKRVETTENVPVRVKAVRAHMRKTGESEPAFVTQAPNMRGGRNFNVRSERPVTVTGPKRSGEATRQGTFDADPEVLVEQAARSQGLVDATDGFRKTIKRFGHRNAGGKLRTFKNRAEAEKALSNIHFDEHGTKRAGVVKMRAVRVNPWGASKEQLQALIDDADHPEAHQKILDEMDSALKGEGGSGKWALIPEAAAERVREHLNAQGGGGAIKSWQLANQAFRKTVLSTSTAWLAGNTLEGLMRAVVGRAGPRSYVTGRRALDELARVSPKAVEEAAVRMVGGGHFSSVERMHVRRGAEQFEFTKLAPIANGLGKFWRSPGPKQAAGLWNAYTDWVFHFNGRLESAVQTAMLGKVIRESGLMDGHLLKLSKAATDDAAKGLKNTDNQIQFGRAVDRMYGKYSKFSPSMRKAVTTYTPFVAWSLNAVNFVFRVLPHDHPTLTLLIAASENATDEWRKSHGLDLFMKGAVPGFLQGSIPVKDGGKLRISRFTPFGAFGDPGDTAAGQVMPLASGVLSALKGKDWKGDDLRVGGQPANPAQRLLFAALAFGEATVPAVSQVANIKKQGPNALNPIKVTKPKAKKSKVRIKAPSSSEFQFDQGSQGFDFDGGSSSGGFKFN